MEGRQRNLPRGAWGGLAGPGLLSAEKRWKQPQTTKSCLLSDSEEGGHWQARNEDSILKPGLLCSTWHRPGQSGRGWCSPSRAGHRPPSVYSPPRPAAFVHGSQHSANLCPARFQRPCPFFHAGCLRAGVHRFVSTSTHG